MLVGGMHRAQYIALDSIFLQQSPSSQHLVMTATSSLVTAITVVVDCRTVHTDSHQHLMICEQRGPRLVDQSSVRLKHMPHSLARTCQSFGERKSLGE